MSIAKKFQLRITHYELRIMHYHNAARPCGLAEKGKVRAFRP